MRKIVTRCNSSSDLYPVTTNTPYTCLATSLTAICPSTWHNRLGHLGAQPLISFLRSNNFIQYNKEYSFEFCNSCPIGKHVSLPFVRSSSSTSCALGIIHDDLWTSPIPNIDGYKYYLVFLDDFTHYLWTIPLKYKSETFQYFLNFQQYVLTQFERAIKSFQSDHGR